MCQHLCQLRLILRGAVATLACILLIAISLSPLYGKSSDRYPVRGQITSVKLKGDQVHVKINIGSENGVFKDMVFRVHRGETYLGKLKVKTVDERFSAGMVSTRPTITDPKTKAKTKPEIKEKDGVLAFLRK